MRIAETVGSRTLLVISSLGLAGALVAAAVGPSAEAPVSRAPLMPMHGCAKTPMPVNVTPPIQPSPREPTLAGQLHVLRTDLARCVDGYVDATLALQLRRDGHVLGVELEGNLGPRPEALRSCVNTVVKSAQFPESETELRVEMLFKQN